ncbi:hypothetical protein IEU95_04290 [Hoyosella rhizosphaerae]|uniref:Fe/B12 periplasmic-binding domain-containing protein n=1 Tax=Hoyosella rhizosphaerae TaxID=1755582 RepID=A0A916UBF8_9ACTN|nr:hypothetical protein [Hoyosella rhizosphaerae]MBN4926034.1 hypothetical protein [Hoyosella rhizosphaerae]GGC66078.1 hypothetical protein GCM10011410_18280 [Hoyosella rhizosphaerae]
MHFGRHSIAVFLAASVAFAAAACGSSEPTDGQTADTRSIVTPLGTYAVPTSPERVVAIDSRQDLEIALALDLPVAGITSRMVRPWVPLRGNPETLRSPVDLVELIRLDTDLIIATNIDDPHWMAPDLNTVAPVIPVDPGVQWDVNLTGIADWLGRSELAATAIARYDDRADRVRNRHLSDDSGERIAIVDLRAPGAVGDLSHPLSLPGAVVADLNAPVVRFTDSPDDILTEEQAPLLNDATRLLVITEDPNIDIDALTADSFFGELPAVQEGKVIISGDITYGSVYTAIEVLDLFDRLYRL